MSSKYSLVTKSALVAALALGAPVMIAACGESVTVVQTPVTVPAARRALEVDLLAVLNTVVPTATNLEAGGATPVFNVAPGPLSDQLEVLQAATLKLVIPPTTAGDYVVTIPAGSVVVRNAASVAIGELTGSFGVRLSLDANAVVTSLEAVDFAFTPFEPPTPEPTDVVTLSATVPAQANAGNIQIVIVDATLPAATRITVPDGIEFLPLFTEGANQVFTAPLAAAFSATEAFTALTVPGIEPGTVIQVRETGGDVIATGTAE